MTLKVTLKAGGTAVTSQDARLITRVLSFAKGEKGAAGDRLPNVHSYYSTSVISPDAGIDDVVVILSQGENLFVNNPSGTMVQEQKLVFRIRDNGSIYSVAWDSKYRGCIAPLPTQTAAGKLMYLGFLYNAQDDMWDLIAFGTQL